MVERGELLPVLGRSVSDQYSLHELGSMAKAHGFRTADTFELELLRFTDCKSLSAYVTQEDVERLQQFSKTIVGQVIDLEVETVFIEGRNNRNKIILGLDDSDVVAHERQQIYEYIETNIKTNTLPDDFAYRANRIFIGTKPGSIPGGKATFVQNLIEVCPDSLELDPIKPTV